MSTIDEAKVAAQGVKDATEAQKSDPTLGLKVAERAGKRCSATKTNKTIDAILATNDLIKVQTLHDKLSKLRDSLTNLDKTVQDGMFQSGTWDLTTYTADVDLAQQYMDFLDIDFLRVDIKLRSLQVANNMPPGQQNQSGGPPPADPGSHRAYPGR